MMPSFLGQPLGTVSRTLQDAGFRLGSVNLAAAAPVPATDSGPVASPEASAAPTEVTPASIIVSQVPGVGQKVVGGSTISFEVR